jgi:hypothetical protein
MKDVKMKPYARYTYQDRLSRLLLFFSSSTYHGTHIDEKRTNNRSLLFFFIRRWNAQTVTTAMTFSREKRLLPMRLDRLVDS